MNEGEKLQRFKRFFDSNSRAILQDCLFRIINYEDSTGALEILCSNQVVRQRLSKKSAKLPTTSTPAGVISDGFRYVSSKIVSCIARIPAMAI